MTYDYETKSSYSVTVKADDGKGGTATIAVTIRVTDLDEAGTITFSPEQPIAGTTLTATLTDQDGVQSVDTWRWELSDDQSSWTEITGATTRSIVPGSSDIGKYLRVTVDYTQTDSFTKIVEAETGAILTAPRTNTDASFPDATVTRSIAENTLAGQPVGAPVTAEEPDSEDTLTYSLSGTDAASFDINTSTGQLQTKAELDYETTQAYYVTVSVTDSKDDYDYADATVDATIDVTIDVTDVNEPPQFAEDAETTQTVAENAAIGDAIGSPYTATDPDAGDTVTYSLSGTDAALFQVGTDGQLQVAGTLNFETKGTHTVIVQATDSEDNDGNLESLAKVDDTHTVTITVTNVFEEPRFDDDDGNGTATRTIAENTADDEPVGAPVSATDDEGDTVTYELGGTDSAAFDFDTTTGQITTKDALDHETKEFYSVIVSASDGKAADGIATDIAMDTIINVNIEVEDVNEPPSFDENAVTGLSVVENTTADTDIGDAYTATDPDENETLTYTLTGADATSFEIDSGTGQIKTLAALDYETKPSYTVTVAVRDSRDDAGDPDTADDATLDITITVTDEDDPGTIRLSPTQPSEGNAVTATLEDDDGIKTDEAVIWKWESSSVPTDPNSWTTIDGATTNTYIPQEEDVGDYLRVNATYEDELGAGKTAEKVSDSEVLDMEPTNELPAFEANLTTTLFVQENTPAGEDIGDPFTATDRDDATLTYVLGGTDSSSFAIDASTGQLQTKDALDYETKPTYSVTVSVHDSKDPFGNANTVADDTIEVTITVTNMDTPAVPDLPTVAATPGAAAGLTVSWTAIEATTLAPVDGYDVQYRVKDTDPSAWNTANVTVSGASATITDLAYSTTYEVQVQAKNAEGVSGWSPTGEGSIPSSLSVSFSPASQTVTEGNSATFTVTVSPDADRELLIPISVTRGSAESGDYTVSGLTNGNLTFADTENSKTFTISTRNDSDRSDETVSLGFGQLPAAVGPGTPFTAQLTIDDTTPAPPPNISSLRVSFEQASYTVTEGSSRTITVNVSPAADRSLSIPISVTRGSAESSDYSVSGTPLSFATGETSKTFTISTTDDDDRDDETLSIGFGSLPAAVGTGSQSIASLTINDTTPAPRSNTGGGGGGGGGGKGGGGGGGSYFGGSSYGRSSSSPPVYSGPPPNNSPFFYEGVSTHRSVEENSGSQTAIGSPISASDGDNDSLTYQLSGLDGASFDINADTGQILSKSVLDFEVQSAYYVFVTVSDGKGGSARISVTIFVIDVDETPEPVPVAQAAVPTPEPTPVPPPTEVPTPEPEPTAPTPGGSDGCAHTYGGSDGGTHANGGSDGGTHANAGADTDSPAHSDRHLGAAPRVAWRLLPAKGAAARNRRSRKRQRGQRRPGRHDGNSRGPDKVPYLAHNPARSGRHNGARSPEYVPQGTRGRQAQVLVPLLGPACVGAGCDV